MAVAAAATTTKKRTHSKDQPQKCSFFTIDIHNEIQKKIRYIWPKYIYQMYGAIELWPVDFSGSLSHMPSPHEGR